MAGSKKTTKPVENTAEKKADAAASAVSAKLSGPLAPLEKSLDGVFGKNAPVQIPAKGREAIVKYSPWIGLVVGVLGLLASLAIWRTAHAVNRLVDFANQLTASYGGHVVEHHLGVAFWVSFVLLVLTSLAAIVAFPALQARKKTGWNLLFYSSLLNVVYGVAALFYDNGGVSSLLSAVISSVVGFYILFQIRSYYK